ncbi:MarR family transcriptional regulator [Streptomyces gardneri]|uniref:bifunctional helix-turn-helix transcriptional regulator/GNAT family N-acetyltransferase n=1 Tax=Nocardia TaxID=1817 RepID=UPI00135B52A8|nr:MULTISPECIES: helix-turn-helix domain-containing GNAT family N-acetyltransferase [Nocardia]MBF6167754.1 MarR family transcriptional regulator [Streptomyces gardneri]MBF6206128.1 MarR family transcriptional regulator [Streptomyces gardneri]
MNKGQIDQVRQFNRIVTERVGVLQDDYLGMDRPIGEARLLWEIDEPGRDVRWLRQRLGLDSGYMSRLLRSMQADGLITVEPQADDRRVRTVRLTPIGRIERDLLDQRSDELAGRLLEPLNPAQRDRLVTAMEEVGRLLTATMVTLDTVAPDHPDAEYCLQSYYAEMRELFDTGFDPAKSLLPDANELAAPHGLLLIARLHGQPVGCAGLKLPPCTPPEIKRMWVAPHVRNLGLARRFLAELEARAARLGHSTLLLDTNKALTPAINLYRSYGFTETAAFNDEPYAHHWFEKRIITTISG